MPEQDIFDRFDLGGVPVAPLPAAEVRRRGDRMRRRQTVLTSVGVAAAVAAIAVGGVLVTQPGGGRTAPPPAGTPDPTPSRTEEAPATIPASFPIDSEGSAPEVPADDFLAQELEFCGETPLAGLTPVDAKSAQTAGGEMNTAMTLLLFNGETDAARAMDALLDSAAACPRQTTNVVGEVEILPESGDDWPGQTIRTSYPADAGYVHAVQAGPALLLSSWYVAGTPAEQGLAESRAAVADQLAAMDETWDVPGWSPPAKGSSDDDLGDAQDIPAGFPLDAAHEDLTGDGGELLGPGPDVRGLEDQLVCGSTLWTVPAVDRLAFVSTGPEYADVRELRTYADAGEAVAQMQEIRSRLAGCDREVREGTTILWTTYDEDTGYDSVTVGSTYENALGGSVFQVTRVGRAVVATMQSGEWALDTAPAGVAERTAVTREIAPGMCTFTEAGC